MRLDLRLNTFNARAKVDFLLAGASLALPGLLTTPKHASTATYWIFIN
jgi:hypothetical protein